MKAIALVPHTKDVKLVDWPEPKIEAPTQVKIKVLQVGICGTDKEEISGGRAEAPKGERLLIIGHEVLGEVIQVGEMVKSVKLKDLVVIMVRRPCNQCEMCKKGWSDMCQSGQYTERGINQRHGFEAYFIVEDEKYLIKIPPSLRSVAVLSEPASVIEKALDEASRIQVTRLSIASDPQKWFAGKNVLVAGIGTLGLLASMILRLRGAHVIGLDIVDPHSIRARLLEKLGGKYILANQKNIHNAQQTYGNIDMILEAAGIARLDFQLFEALGMDGIYVLTGLAGDAAPITVDVAMVMRNLVLKNQLVLGTVNARKEHFKQAVIDFENAKAKWGGVIEEMITSKTHYTKFEQAFLKKGSDEIKAVIEWAE